MNNKSITFLLGCLVTASITMQVLAQQPAEHEFIRGDMPPGVAARFYQMSDPALRGHVQAYLLYTSPSPRDKRQSRMPSSA